MQAFPVELEKVELDMANPPREPTIVIKGIWGWAAKRLGIEPWGQILIILLIGQATVIWGIRTDVSEIKGSVQTMPLAISRDLLSQAKEDVSTKNFARAKRATDSAEILLARSAAKQIPAKPDDFSDLLVDLNMLSAASGKSELSESVNNARVVLANYRSALEPRPKMQGQQVQVEKTDILTVEAATIDKSAFPGSVLIAPPGAQFDFLGTSMVRKLANANSVTGIGFRNGSQTLDGFHWNGDVFLDTAIRYEGGELELSNTRFVNCTFQMSDNARSSKVAAYVTLNQSYLKIGPDQ